MAKILKKDELGEALSLEGRLELEPFAGGDADRESKIISPQSLQHKQLRQDILTTARAEAEDIKRQAKELYLTVEDKIRQASEKGFAEGREQGLESVTELLVKINQNHEKLLRELEKQALSLVLEISHKVLGDALKSSDEAMVGLIREALKESMGNELVVLIHPDDFEKVREQQSNLIGAVQGSQTLQIKASASVKSGSCLIESELGTLEAQLDLQLAAIARALGISNE